jgi:gas vesicle protein
MNLKDITDLEANDLLAAVGLASRKSATSQILSAVGIFASGVLLGGITALLFAPKTGRGLREDLGNRIRSVPDAVRSALPNGKAQESTNAV